MTDIWHLIVFCGFCAAFFIADVLFRRVPNATLVLAIVVQLMFLFFFPGTDEFPTNSGRSAALGLFIGFLIFIPLYVFRAMGAGDVKLFALLGFWLGPAALVPIWVAGSLLAGIHAVTSMTLGTGTGATGLMVESTLQRWPAWMAWRGYLTARREGRKGIPYAGYLAVAAMGFLVWHGGFPP